MALKRSLEKYRWWKETVLERSGLLPINPEGNLVPKALKVAIALLEMSNWVISVNIKQLVPKKKKKKTIQEILPSSIRRQSENLRLKMVHLAHSWIHRSSCADRDSKVLNNQGHHSSSPPSPRPADVHWDVQMCLERIYRVGMGGETHGHTAAGAHGMRWAACMAAAWSVPSRHRGKHDCGFDRNREMRVIGDWVFQTWAYKCFWDWTIFIPDIYIYKLNACQYIGINSMLATPSSPCQFKSKQRPLKTTASWVSVDKHATEWHCLEFRTSMVRCKFGGRKKAMHLPLPTEWISASDCMAQRGRF